MINATSAAGRIKVPSTQKTISGEVDPAFINGLVRQGLQRNQLITDASQLVPADEAAARLQKLGWKSAGISEHFQRLAIRPAQTRQTPFPIGQSVTFASRGDVAYKPDQDVVLTTSKDGLEEQIICLDAKGNVTYNYRRAT